MSIIKKQFNGLERLKFYQTLFAPEKRDKNAVMRFVCASLKIA